MPDWLSSLSAKGIELWYEGDRLRFRAPQGGLGADDRAALSARKAEIIADLRARDAGQQTTGPLSYSQRSMWFVHQEDPQSSAYNVAFAARVVSAIDLPALRHALQALLDRHPSLRTTFPKVDWIPVQRVAGAATISLDLHAVPDTDDVTLRQRVLADYRRAFDLEGGPLIRASLYTRGPADHVLLIALHHIIVDGWSVMLLLDELRALYAEATGGASKPLPRPAHLYTDFTAAQAELLAGPEGEKLAGYWQRQLAEPRAQIELTPDRPRPPRRSSRGATLTFDLDADLSAAVHKLARDEGVTIFVVLLAAFKALLYRNTGTEDVVIGSATFGRNRPELARVVGDFVNVIPFRTRLAADLPFRDLLARVQTTVFEAIDAQDFPLTLMVERLKPARDPSRTPLFGIAFLLQRYDHLRELEPVMVPGGPAGAIDFGGLRLEKYFIDQQEGQFDLTLNMVDRGGALTGQIAYSLDLFEEATAVRLAAQYRNLLAGIVKAPGAALSQLPLEEPSAATGETIDDLIARLRESDIRLFLDGGKLRVNAPKGAMTDELKATIAARRDALIAALGRTADSRNGLRRVPRDGPLQSSSAQHRFWFLDRVEPGRSYYNIGLSVHFRGPLDAAVLARAVDELALRHESLRTRIGERDGLPDVTILPANPAALEIVDLASVPADARAEEARRRAAERLQRPFDLARGPLTGYLLARLAPDHHVLTISMHHAVSDGWSLFLAVRELCIIYDALAAGRAPELPPLPLQYVDYAVWEREQARSGRLGPHLAYWQKALAGAPGVLELPTDRPRPAAQSFHGRRLRRNFRPGLLERVKELGRQKDTTLFVTLLAAWEVLIRRHSRQDDFLIGTPMANRDLVATEGMIGCFINTVVLRARLGDNPTFAEHLQRVKQAVLEALDHRELPFDALVDALRPDRNASHAPLVQVLFALHSFPLGFAAPRGLAAEIEATDAGTSRVDLSIELADDGDKLAALYEFATDLFDDETISRLHEHFETLLEAIVREPDGRIEALRLLGAEEEELVARTWNDTGLEHDRGRCVHHLLEATARSNGDAIAVVAGETTLTYRALDTRANQLAHLLVKRGVRPRSLVAVCVDRTADMPVALAAVHKAGAAYVPLDPTHPADRLRYTLEDAGVACAITLARFAPMFPGVPLVLLDEAGAELAALPATPPGAEAAPADRAYVIYTSGSTGRPKGVEVEHRNVVAFLEAMRREPGLGARDVLLAVTTLSFDIAGLEMWLPLMVGARIVIASRTDVLDGERLMGLLDEQKVTVMQATPATWRLMLDAGWPGKRDLKVLCGGEALPRDLAANLVDRIGELWNVYGPTETTIWSTACQVTDVAAPITIGRPIANTRIYVLEPSGLLAPIGVPGELCIAGEGVARGYHDRPELTAEKFVVLPIPGGTGERAYRTGDVARLRADATIDFLGRRDHQVKVRGYRIELGEIEAVLAKHAGVKECAVIVREDVAGDQRLVAYVVSAGGADFEPEAARATLREKLPDYMIPNLFMVLPALPLTPNGKIDRKALPAPTQPAEVVDTTAEAMMTAPQRRVAGIWREVLNATRVGLHDNFFDVGGHSLLLVKLHALLRREFQSELGLVDLFQWTTVAAQADRLTASGPGDGALRRARDRAARQSDG